MIRHLLLLAAGAAACVLPADGARAEPAPVVFFDIAAPEMSRQAAFYRAVFDWPIAADGGFAVPVSSPLRATLRAEPPGLGPQTERLVYVGVRDIDATLALVVANGGAVVYPRTVAPGVVVLALFTDPAGNRMGLVEIGGDAAPAAP